MKNTTIDEAINKASIRPHDTRPLEALKLEAIEQITVLVDREYVKEVIALVLEKQRQQGQDFLDNLHKDDPKATHNPNTKTQGKE